MDAPEEEEEEVLLFNEDEPQKSPKFEPEEANDMEVDLGTSLLSQKDEDTLLSQKDDDTP